MAWFKVDDKLHDHRKARKAGRSAMGVWVLAGSWSADNLTDGFVPASVLPRWGTPVDARKLVAVDLWYADEQDGEKGWRFHEWLEFQPSRAQKLEERRIRAEAGRLGGKASGRSRREAKPKQDASRPVEPPYPTRPVPDQSDTDVSDTAARAADHFDRFWAIYPRKVSKPNARKAWATAVKKVDGEVLISAATDFARSCAAHGTEQQYIAHPATWLNNERWDDDLPAPPTTKESQGRIGDHLALVAELRAEEQHPLPHRQIGS